MTASATPPGEGLALAQCPIGLFWCGDTLCLKTEYGNNEGRIDAYIVSSGEFFWGSQPQTIANQRATPVVPIDTGEAVSALNTRAADKGGEVVGEWVMVPREVLERRSVPTMDPPWSAAFNAALDMVRQSAAPSAPTPADHVPDCERCREPSPQGIRCYTCLAGEVEQLRIEAERDAIHLNVAAPTPANLGDGLAEIVSDGIRWMGTAERAEWNVRARHPHPLPRREARMSTYINDDGSVTTNAAPRMTPAQPSAETGEALAEALCNDWDARVIAGREYADSYTSSAAHVQEYWKAIAHASLAHSTPPASDVIDRAVAAETERCLSIILERANGIRMDEALSDAYAAIRRSQPASDEGNGS